jgi:uncharacterized DUF497 family protein
MFDDFFRVDNMQTHGIDFIEAQALWSDPDYIEIFVKTTGEPRFLVICRIAAGQGGAAAWCAETIHYQSVGRGKA